MAEGCIHNVATLKELMTMEDNLGPNFFGLFFINQLGTVLAFQNDITLHSVTFQS